MEKNPSIYSEGADESWKCATCGTSHSDLPLSFAADFPDFYANLNVDERDVRGVIGGDQCIVDDKWFFIRGCLEIPILGQSEPFLWGVWSSVHQEVFDEISSCWTQQGREKLHGPFKGRLANSLSVYPETHNLKLEIRIQPVGIRPLFLVKEPEHQLAVEQAQGITRTRAMDLAAFLLHQAGRRTPNRKA